MIFPIVLAISPPILICFECSRALFVGGRYRNPYPYPYPTVPYLSTRRGSKTRDNLYCQLINHCYLIHHCQLITASSLFILISLAWLPSTIFHHHTITIFHHHTITISDQLISQYQDNEGIIPHKSNNPFSCSHYHYLFTITPSPPQTN